MRPSSTRTTAIGAAVVAAAGSMAAAQNVSNTFPKPPLRPFIDPIEMHQWWFLLLLPMAFLVAMTYKAVRLPTLEKYWWNVLVMAMQIVVGMIGLGAATYFVVFVVAKMVAERAG